SVEREANRATARAGKEEADQRLERLKATRMTGEDFENLSDVQSLKIKTLEAQQTQALRNTNEQMTYGAWERYDSSGEIKPLNVMLEDLRATDSKLYSDYARFDNLTEADAELMEQAGPVDHDKILNDPTVSRSFVKATMKDGTEQIVNLDNLKAQTRYGKYASTEELRRMKESKEILMLEHMGYDTKEAREAFRAVSARLGPSVDPSSPEFKNAVTEEIEATAIRKQTRFGASTNLSVEEAIVENRMIEMDLDYNDPKNAGIRDAITTQVNKERNQTSAVKNLEAVDLARENLDKAGFDKVDWTQPTDYKTRRKFESNIKRIEVLAKAELSATELASLQSVKYMTSLADSAKELKPEQTGIIDSFFHNVRKYVSDNTDGIDATSAYAAFNNVMRNALYGATLPEGEIRMFQDAAGTLKHQQGPVLVQLRTSFEQVKAMYDTMLATNDPDVMLFRTGMDAVQIEKISQALDERISMIDRVSRGASATKSVGSGLTADDITVIPSTGLTDEKRAIANRVYRGEG
ncbi:MAG: hypothetical protein DRQ40_05155, partial [Gammaproteobacteria bacterium]